MILNVKANSHYDPLWQGPRPLRPRLRPRVRRRRQPARIRCFRPLRLLLAKSNIIEYIGVRILRCYLCVGTHFNNSQLPLLPQIIILT